MRRTLLLLTTCWIGWTAPSITRPGQRVFRVPFWVSEGAPVASRDLEVRVNGQAAKVTRLLDGNDDLLLLVVLDWSGDLSLVDPSRTALTEAIGKLPPNVHVGLLRAQDNLRVLLDPGGDRDKLVELIRGLGVSGRAGLLNAIEPMQQLADGVTAAARVRVAVLYVSDSNIANYREDYTNPVVNSNDSGDMSRRFPEGLVHEKIKQLLAAVLQGEAPMFLVHLNYQSDRLNTAYQTGLLDLMAASGGASEFCRSLAEIPQAIEKMMGLIVSGQSAEVVCQGGKSRQAEISLEAEGRTLHFRQRRQWKVANQ